MPDIEFPTSAGTTPGYAADGCADGWKPLKDTANIVAF